MEHQTPLRKQLSAIRKTAGESATEMAERLGISRAFLNYMETGYKSAPQEVLKKIQKEYALSRDECRDLCQAAEISPQTCRIDVSDLSYWQRKKLQEHIAGYREQGRMQEALRGAERKELIIGMPQ